MQFVHEKEGSLMQRYFIHPTQIQNDSIVLEAGDAHHIKNVMRQKIGDRLLCVLAPNQVFETEILALTDKTVETKIICERTENHELPVNITIAQGLPKGEKLEWVLQKGTELGMHRYIPLQMERSIVKIDQNKIEKRMLRWQKIIKEAAEQSQRNIIPEISSVQTIRTLIIDSVQYTHKLIAYEESAKKNEYKKNIRNILCNIPAGAHILMVFGPEGGISISEIEMCMQAGFIPCALGPRILRTETAPLYFLSAVSYALEL